MTEWLIVQRNSLGHSHIILACAKFAAGQAGWLDRGHHECSGCLHSATCYLLCVAAVFCVTESFCVTLAVKGPNFDFMPQWLKTPDISLVDKDILQHPESWAHTHPSRAAFIESLRTVLVYTLWALFCLMYLNSLVELHRISHNYTTQWTKLAGLPHTRCCFFSHTECLSQRWKLRNKKWQSLEGHNTHSSCHSNVVRLESCVFMFWLLLPESSVVSECLEWCEG